MKIEYGKRYLRADGGVTTKLEKNNLENFPFVDGDITADGASYTEEGHLYMGVTNALDLIAEVPEHILEKFIKDVLEYHIKK